MFRRNLITMLLDRPMSLSEIARQERVLPSEVEQDLKHLLKSLKHTEYALEVIPADCRKCDFEFDRSKLRKPSKCPKCRSTWINEPVISVVRREVGSASGNS